MADIVSSKENSGEESDVGSVQKHEANGKTELDATPTHVQVYPSGMKRNLVIVSVTLAYFLLFLDMAIISTATPSITSRFNSLVDVGWYVLASLFMSASVVPLTKRRCTGMAAPISSAAQRSSL